jgi:hypothetical protein
MGWAKEELGDAYVNQRLMRRAEDLSAHPTASLAQACQGWAEIQTAYRFFTREEWDGRAILQPPGERIEECPRACPRGLCPQESTQLDATPPPSITLADAGKLWAALEQAPMRGQGQFTLAKDGACPSSGFFLPHCTHGHSPFPYHRLAQPRLSFAQSTLYFFCPSPDGSHQVFTTQLIPVQKLI